MVYEVHSNGVFGDSYVVAKIAHRSLSLGRNTKPGTTREVQERYYLKIYGTTTGTYSSIPLSEDDLQNLFKAYLAIRRDLEERP